MTRVRWSSRKTSNGQRTAGHGARLRAIELLLRTQDELLTGVLAELEQTRRCAEESKVDGVLPAPVEPYHHAQSGLLIQSGRTRFT